MSTDEPAGPVEPPPYTAERRPLIKINVRALPRPRSERVEMAPVWKPVACAAVVAPELLAALICRNSSSTVVAPVRSISSFFNICTGSAVSPLICLIDDPVTTISARPESSLNEGAELSAKPALCAGRPWGEGVAVACASLIS